MWANVFIEDDDMVPSLDTSSESFSRDLIVGVKVYFGLSFLSNTTLDPNTLLSNFFFVFPSAFR